MEPVTEVEPTPATRRHLLWTAACCTLVIVASNLTTLPILLQQARSTERLARELQQFSVDSKTWRDRHHQLLDDFDRYAREEFKRLHDDLELLKQRGN